MSVEAVESVWVEIEAVAKVTCTKCETQKHPVLFTPGELKKKWPTCRMCRKRKRSTR